LTSATDKGRRIKSVRQAPAPGDPRPVVVGPRAPAFGSARFRLRLRAWRRPSAFSLLVLLFGLIAIAPLLQPGYFWGAHDARHDVYFLFQYDKSVLEGNWLPRWGPDWAFGYGYPFWIIYAPLAVFLGELGHHFLGLGWETSVKTVLGFSIVLSGLGMYGFARSWLGRRAGLLAAIAYMLIPYHLVDVYVRAALPESLALALLPFVLWFFRLTVMRPRLANILGASFVYAALWWTHNLTALIFTPVLMVYVLALAWWRDRPSIEGECAIAGSPESAERMNELLPPQRRLFSGQRTGSKPEATSRRRPARLVRAFSLRLLAPLAAGLLAFGLSAAFLIPAALEARNVNQAQWFGSYYNPFQHFVYFFQLFNPAWGFGISAPGPDDVSQGALSYQLGAIPALLSAITLFTARRLGNVRRRELWLLGLFAGAAVFLTLNISAPAWHLPLVPYAQFPWRYLLVAIPFLSLLAGAILANPADAEAGEPEALDWPVVVLAGVLLLGSYPYLQVQMREPTVEQGPVSYAALMRFQRTSNEMTGVTAWVDPNQIPIWSPMADEWVAGRQVKTKVDYSQGQTPALAVNEEGLGAASEEVWYHAGQDGQSITFNRFWYPGWKAYLLDSLHGRIVREIPVVRENGPLARLVVPVPVGESFLLVRFEDTPLRSVSKWLTLATIALIAGLVVARIGFARLQRRSA
jgi:hypothetical protein